MKNQEFVAKNDDKCLHHIQNCRLILFYIKNINYCNSSHEKRL